MQSTSKLYEHNVMCPRNHHRWRDGAERFIHVIKDADDTPTAV
jgi:hypothetical protein